MEAIVYSGSYWENLDNIECENKDLYRKWSVRRSKDFFSRIDAFQLVLIEDLPLIVEARCLPHDPNLLRNLREYRKLGEELGNLATNYDIFSCKFNNGMRFDRKTGDEEITAEIDKAGFICFQGGFISRLSKLVRARGGIQLIGTS